MDIALYGNIIVDSVYELGGALEKGAPNLAHSYYKQVGSLGNSCRFLDSFFPNLELLCVGLVGEDLDGNHAKSILGTMANVDCVDISPWNTTSHATIVSHGSNKTGVVYWDACTQLSGFPEVDARWHHIMYLDRLPAVTPEEIDCLSRRGIVSVDLCMNDYTQDERDRLMKCLPYIDYLIISDQEANALVQPATELETATKILGHQVRRGAIVHHAGGSLFSSGIDMHTHDIVESYNVNVLGAGDSFAAALMGYCLLMDSRITTEIIGLAHNMTGKFLKAR